MTRVLLLAVVVAAVLGTLSGCSDDKTTGAGASVVTQPGGEPVSTLKGTARLPKGP